MSSKTSGEALVNRLLDARFEPEVVTFRGHFDTAGARGV